MSGPARVGADLETTRRAVLAAVQEMDRIGLTEGTAGNVSARTREGLVVLTPTALPYASMTLDDLAVTDLDGKPVSNGPAATTEIGLHLACLKQHPDIAAVVHTHPVFASMFAVNHQPIPCVIEEFEFYVGGDVRVAPYHRTGSEKLGPAVAALLGDRAAALLANHGLVVVGADPSEALQLTKLVERAARIVHGARLLGEPVPLPESVRESFSAEYLSRRRRATEPRSER